MIKTTALFLCFLSLTATLSAPLFARFPYTDYSEVYYSCEGGKIGLICDRGRLASCTENLCDDPASWIEPKL